MDFQRDMNKAIRYHTGGAEYFPHFRTSSGTIGGLHGSTFSKGFVGTPELEEYIILGRGLDETKKYFTDVKGNVRFASGCFPVQAVAVSVEDKISHFLASNGINTDHFDLATVAIAAIAKEYNIDIRNDHELCLEWINGYTNRPKMMLCDIKDGKCEWLEWKGEKV